ncbi:MAG: hypothetical protein ACYTEU_03480 [Planctomycetota bacterium]|jgi:alanine dehydrogenase
MKLFVTSETDSAETRVAMLPADTAKLVRLGADVEIKKGFGKLINITMT